MKTTRPPRNTEAAFDELEVEHLTKGIKQGSVQHVWSHTAWMQHECETYWPGANLITIVEDV